MALSSALFGASLVVWLLFVYKIMAESTLPVQKILALIPVLKGMECLLYMLEFQTCPWDSADVAEDAYLRMGKVTTVTFAYTFIHALFYMLCKGWNTTTQIVDRNIATNLTLVMGVIYLIYSAYFLSSDFLGMKEFVNGCLAVTYMILGIVNYKSLHQQIHIVKTLASQAEETVPAVFIESVKLKYKMLK